MQAAGQVQFGGSIYETSFRSRCLAGGKRTPANLCTSAGLKNLRKDERPKCITRFLIRFTLTAVIIPVTVPSLLSQLLRDAVFFVCQYFFFLCPVYAGHSMWGLSDNLSNKASQSRTNRQPCREVKVLQCFHEAKKLIFLKTFTWYITDLFLCN